MTLTKLAFASIIAASFFASPKAAKAMDTDTKKVTSMCFLIGNPVRCNRSGDCFWDNEDNRCEPLNGGLCGTITNPNVCNRQILCAWDGEDGRCELRF